MTKRLPASTFEFPLAEVRRGYRSAIYFNRTKQIVSKADDLPKGRECTMQIFQRNTAIACGIDEVLALLKYCTGHWSDQEQAEQVFDYYMAAKLESRRNPLSREAAVYVLDLELKLEELWVPGISELEVHALYDGDRVAPVEPVITIKGDYSLFAHLESVYLGILARATKVATNTNNVVTAAKGKDVLFFADRFDRWSNQGADGYAAHKGGAVGVASPAMAQWWGALAMGTMPHALIAMYNGDSVAASKAFVKEYPDTYLVTLVDFNNNCLDESLLVAQELGETLWAVRLDTSGYLQDPCVQYHPLYGQLSPIGVNIMLVEQVRKALDKNGFEHVKIVVSGGFNASKVEHFEAYQAPVDTYAVGSSLIQGAYDYTADIVSPTVKVGRCKIENPNLALVDFSKI